jgi:hypothetical protein
MRVARKRYIRKEQKMLTRARAFSLTMVVLLVLTLVPGTPATAAPTRTQISRIEVDTFDGETNDLSNPGRPLFSTADTENTGLIGQIGGMSLGVVVQGNTAYVGAGPRLRLLDISDPTDPVALGETPTLPSVVEDVAVSASYAYLAVGASGLRVVSISDPAHPQEVGYLGLSGYAKAVFISGSYCYVACEGAGVRIVSIVDPTAPQEVGAYNSPDCALDVFAAGSHVYVADREKGLRVVSVADPAHPIEVGAYDTGGKAESVFVYGDHAYVADGDDGLRVIAVSDPTNPTEVGDYNTPGYARGVFVSNSRAYLTDGWSGLRILSVADPTHPVELGVYDTPGEAHDVVVSGFYAYVCDEARGLRMVSIADAAHPQEVGAYEKLGDCGSVVVSDSYAYAAGQGGLWILSIADPAHPEVVSNYHAPEGATHVFLSGSYAYVTAWGAGLRIVSVADPAHPVEVASWDTPGLATHVVVSNDYAYVADWHQGLRIISVSDPLNPVEVGSCDTPGNARQVVVSGDYAYVADQDDGGLRVISVADPSNPHEVGGLDTPGQAQGVFVSDSYAYIADGWQGLRVISVADPTHPQEVAAYPTTFYAYSGSVVGSYAYVAEAWAGFEVISIADPANPQGIDTVDTPGYAWTVTDSESYAYVGDGFGGLTIMRSPTPTDLELLDFSWVPDSPVEFEPVSFILTIRNAGDARFDAQDGNYEIKLEEGSGVFYPLEYYFSTEVEGSRQRLTPQKLEPLEPGETTLVVVSDVRFSSPIPESTPITVTLTPKDDDHNLNNNWIQKNFSVQETPEGWFWCWGIAMKAIFQTAVSMLPAPGAPILAAITTDGLDALGKMERCDPSSTCAAEAASDFLFYTAVNVASGDPVAAAIALLKSALETLYELGRCVDWIADTLLDIIAGLKLRGFAVNAVLAESPVYVLVTNERGERAGFLDDGSIIQEIEDAEVLSRDSAKIVLYPGSDTANVRVKGTDAGTYDLKLALSTEGRQTAQVEYLNVPVTSDTVGVVDAQDKDYVMEIDENGDGIVDSTRLPDNITIVGPTVYLPLILRDPS